MTPDHDSEYAAAYPDPYADLPDPDDEGTDLPDLGPVLGVVLEGDRGTLPFALIHGEALVACAAWALGDTGVTMLDHGIPWESVVAAEEPLVLHDALCPMTPAWFISRCVQTAVERSAVVVGVRPVTDTVKALGEAEGVPVVGDTVDRAGLLTVTSPVVLPAEVVASLGDLPGADLPGADLPGADLPGADLPGADLPTLAGVLAQRFPVLTLEAPAEGRRVGSLDDVRLLEALTARAPRHP